MHNTWSRIPTALKTKIKQHYDTNNLSYHNWSHVERLYSWAEYWSVPYSPALDLAIAMHDAVYDTNGFNELRSAKLIRPLIDSFKGCVGLFSDATVCNDAYKLVMATANHKFSDCLAANTMVLLDLADFSVDFYRTRNCEKIRLEYNHFYNPWDATEFYRKNADFLITLRKELVATMTFLLADCSCKDCSCKSKLWTTRAIAVIDGISRQISKSNVACGREQ